MKNAGSKVAINDDLMEYFISNTGSYQKGFTSKELVSYLKDALGDGFTVEPTRKFGAVSAIVTRDGDRLSLKGRDILQENAALQEENRLLREQMKDYIAIQRRNGKLQESRDYWQGQTRRTQRVTTDKKAVTAAAKQLIQNYGADIAVKDIQGDLQSLYDYIASGYDGKDELHVPGWHNRQCRARGHWEQGYRILRHFRRANGMACKPGGYAGRRLGNRGVKEGAHHGYYDHH